MGHKSADVTRPRLSISVTATLVTIQSRITGSTYKAITVIKRWQTLLNGCPQGRKEENICDKLVTNCNAKQFTNWQKSRFCEGFVVARDGIEPSTLRFSVGFGNHHHDRQLSASTTVAPSAGRCTAAQPSFADASVSYASPTATISPFPAFGRIRYLPAMPSSTLNVLPCLTPYSLLGTGKKPAITGSISRRGGMPHAIRSPCHREATNPLLPSLNARSQVWG